MAAFGSIWNGTNGALRLESYSVAQAVLEWRSNAPSPETSALTLDWIQILPT